MADEQVKAPVVPGSGEGLGGPNATPTFGNSPQTDNNRPVERQEDLDSFEKGAKVATDSNVAGFQASDEILAAANAGEEQEGFTQYASPSIARLKIGSFEFENGVLRVKNEDVERFEKLLKSTDIRFQQAVSKIDREGGEAVARRFLEQTGGRRISGVDTSDSTPAAANPSDPDNKPAALPIGQNK